MFEIAVLTLIESVCYNHALLAKADYVQCRQELYKCIDTPKDGKSINEAVVDCVREYKKDETKKACGMPSRKHK